MNLEIVSCPACSEARSEFWASENGFNAVKCAACGLVYVNPRPALAEICEATITGVHQNGTQILDVVSRRKRSKIGTYRRLLRGMFRREVVERPAIRWLDVGAGYGEFLEAVQGVFPKATSVIGVEPMVPKAEVARSNGLQVVSGPLDALDGAYDVLSLVNVFSHIPDFASFCLSVRTKLNPSGILFIETGNGADIPKREDYPGPLYLPDHLVFAGVKQMIGMLEGSGFVVEEVQKRRVDGAFWTAKCAVRSALNGHPQIRLPYSSPFRTVFFKARRSP